MFSSSLVGQTSYYFLISNVIWNLLFATASYSRRHSFPGTMLSSRDSRSMCMKSTDILHNWKTSAAVHCGHQPTGFMVEKTSRNWDGFKNDGTAHDRRCWVGSHQISLAYFSLIFLFQKQLAIDISFRWVCPTINSLFSSSDLAKISAGSHFAGFWTVFFLTFSVPSICFRFCFRKGWDDL